MEIRFPVLSHLISGIASGRAFIIIKPLYSSVYSFPSLSNEETRLSGDPKTSASEFIEYIEVTCFIYYTHRNDNHTLACYPSIKRWTHYYVVGNLKKLNLNKKILFHDFLVLSLTVSSSFESPTTQPCVIRRDRDRVIAVCLSHSHELFLNCVENQETCCLYIFNMC